MGLFQDFYNAWKNNRTMQDEWEHNQQLIRGQQYHQLAMRELKQREVEALEKLAQKEEQK